MLSCQITGVGSLPFVNRDQAWNFSNQFDFPFRPELPKLNPKESMLGQLSHWSEDIFSFASENHLLLLAGKRLALHYPGPDARYFLEDQARMGLATYLDDLSQKWQSDCTFYLAHSIRPVLFLDMPGIQEWALSYPHEMNYFRDWVKQNKQSGRWPSEWGIHCCGSFDPGEVFSMSPAFFSFDALTLSPVVLGNLVRLWSQQTRHETYTLIWGLVNFQGQALEQAQWACLSNYIQALRSKYTDQDLEIIISPTCGLLGVSLPVEEIFQRLREIQKKIEQLI